MENNADFPNHGDAVQSESAEDQAAAAQRDHLSDPARNDEVGHDWTDEGGATPDGPATEGNEER